MAKKDRADRIRKVRSLAELLEILKEIRVESESDSKTAQRLFKSLSTGPKDETIVIQHAPAGKVSRISTRGKKVKIDFTGKVTNFKAPPSSSIEKHVTVLQSLYENAKELDAVEAMLRQQFTGVKAQQAALAGVTALRTSVDASIQTALTALNRVATNHFPSEMEALRDELTEYLINNIPEDQYEDIGFLEYVSLGGKGEIVFSVYVEIDLLKNSGGYVFDEYFIILTGIVNSKGGIAYFVNALPDFKVPGKYPMGKQVSSLMEIQQRVSLLLAHNDVMTRFERAPLPFHDDKDAHSKGFTAITGVKGAKVADDALLLEVNTTASLTVQKKIAAETTLLLNQAMRRKKDASISWKKITQGGKTYLKFILYFKPGSAPTNLNLTKFNEMVHTLNLDDSTTRKLRYSLLD